MTYSTKELRHMGVAEERIALRKFRREHGPLRLAEAAAMIGVTKATLERFERGETRRPRASTLARISDFLLRWQGH